MDYVSIRITFGIICIIAYVALFIYAVRAYKIGKLQSNLIYIAIVGFVISLYSSDLVFAFKYFTNETKTQHIAVDGVHYYSYIEPSSIFSFLDVDTYKRAVISGSNGGYYIVNDPELKEKIKHGGTVENGVISKEMTIEYIYGDAPGVSIIKSY